MSDINAVAITGRLTRDPELRTVGQSTSVCELGVAVNGREKRDGVWQERTEFVDVTVWGSQGENCATYLAKGRGVAISGRLRLDQWEKDGQKRSKLRIVADHVQFLSDGNRGEGGGSSSSQASPGEAPSSTSVV